MFKRIRRALSVFGPGIITGAADDDPSGIVTYTIAGAQLGTGLLWAILVTWPLMAAVQMMAARIPMVTGAGLGKALRRRFPRPLVLGAVALVVVANSINVGADLSAMADTTEMLTGGNSHLYVIGYAILMTVAMIRFHYHTIAGVFKWLTVSLFAYVATAFIVGPPWGEVFKATLVPSWPQDRAAWSTLVALLGTTISPYLFFWQASEEIEEEQSHGLKPSVGAGREELRNRMIDVTAGTFFSNAVAYFIILAGAFALHAHGVTNVSTSRQAAEALAPVAGKWAGLLYTVGLITIGFLSIPTLVGASAFALAEVFGWRRGLDKSLRSARGFYGVIIASTVFGVAMDFLDVSPVRALYGSAVINGLVAPIIMAGMLILAASPRFMQGQPSSRLAVIMVALATLLMLGAAVGLFLL